MSKYTVPDPWPSRVREALALIFVCSWRGHDPAQKMYGPGACRRCNR